MSANLLSKVTIVSLRLQAVSWTPVAVMVPEGRNGILIGV